MAGNKDLKLNEPEIVIYAKITNPAGLDEALRHEGHVQLEGEMTTGPRIRCRKTSKGAVKSYTQTIKVPIKTDADVQANHEENTEVTEQFFRIFAHCAKKAVKKTRYTYESTNVTFTMEKDGKADTVVLPKIFYEVDVFENKDGQFLNWCKIDIEIKPVLDALKEKGIDFLNGSNKFNVKISHLPFKPVNPIMSTSDLPEHKDFFDKFWEQANLNPMEVLDD